MTKKEDFKIDVCPSTLAIGFTTYSPIALRNLFNGQEVSPILGYNSPINSEVIAEKFMESGEKILFNLLQHQTKLLE